jgi:hypothetical protein
MNPPVSLVKSCQEFFSLGRHGRKIEIPEFKALTRQDKEDLREMLIGEGYNVLPLPTEDTSS